MKLKNILLLSSAVLLFGCSTTNNQTSTTQTTTQEATRPSYLYNSAFYVGKDGKALTEEETKDKLIVEWYIDPSCSACVALETAMKEETEELLNSGEVVYKVNPLGFLSSRTPDNYSYRAGAYILGTVEHSPELALKFLSNVMSTKFAPLGKVKQDDEFKKLYLEIGGTEETWNKILADKDKNITSLQKKTENSINSEELKAKSEIGRLYTPFILIEGNEKAIYTKDGQDYDSAVEEIMKIINEKRQNKS